MNLQVIDVLDPSGTRRLDLEGELDLATAAGLGDRLSELAAAEEPVRIDLSRLEFMDSTGIKLFVGALKDARANGWQLEIDTNVSHPVARVLEVTGVDAFFWPENRLARPANGNS